MDTINENAQGTTYPNGTIIADRFEIESFLAAGGMAQVYVARQMNIDRRVAMKVLSPMFSMNPSVVMRFFREARVIAQLSHPNTVRLFDMGETPDKRLYMAMELLEGVELSERIRQGRMKAEEAIPIVRQVAGSLSEAHSKGIIHRDLKPDNIFLTKLNIVKVLDFGIAKLKQSEDEDERKLTKVGTAPGTPEYMSPEQARGKELDARSDLYSLGIVLYEMLAGHPPFEEDTFLATILMHVQSPPPPLPDDVPADLRNYVVNRLLAKDPNCRPDNADAFIAELDELEQKLNPSKEQALIDDLRSQLAATKLELLRSCEHNIIEEADADRLYSERVQAEQLRIESNRIAPPRLPAMPQRSPAQQMPGSQQLSGMPQYPGSQAPMSGAINPQAMGQSAQGPMSGVMGAINPQAMGQSPQGPMSGVMGANNPQAMGQMPGSQGPMSGVMGAINPQAMGQSPQGPMSGVMGAINPQAMGQMPGSQGPMSGVMGAINPQTMGQMPGSQGPMSGVMGAINPQAMGQSAQGPMSGVMGTQNPRASAPQMPGARQMPRQPQNPSVPQSMMGAQNPRASAPQMPGARQMPAAPQNPSDSQLPRAQAPNAMGQNMQRPRAPHTVQAPEPFARKPSQSQIRPQAVYFTPGGESDESIVVPTPRHQSMSMAPVGLKGAHTNAKFDDDANEAMLSRPRSSLTGKPVSAAQSLMSKPPLVVFLEFAQPLLKSQPREVEAMLTISSIVWNAANFGAQGVTELLNSLRDRPNHLKLANLMLTRKEKYFADYYWKIENLRVEILDGDKFKCDFDCVGE